MLHGTWTWRHILLIYLRYWRVLLLKLVKRDNIVCVYQTLVVIDQIYDVVVKKWPMATN